LLVKALTRGLLMLIDLSGHTMCSNCSFER
jgi:hypothetical protein